MTTDLRAALSELVDAIRDSSEYRLWDAIGAAEDALAANPVPIAPEGRPSDDDLWSLAHEEFRKNCWPTEAIEFARAVLSRYGTPAPVPHQISSPEIPDSSFDTPAPVPVAEPSDEEIDAFILRTWARSPGRVSDREWREDMAVMIRAAFDELAGKAT